MSRPAVFLDRDGVLNASVVRCGQPHPPQTVDELRVLPGVPHACRQLSEAGLVLVCVTNQPDIARGTQDVATVAAINERLQEALGLVEVMVCPHDDADDCACRKPRPGMILDAASRLGLDVSRSVTVGDRWRDIEAGRAAGTWTALIDHGYTEQQADRPDLIVNGLKEAVAWIIGKADSQS